MEFGRLSAGSRCETGWIARAAMSGLGVVLLSVVAVVAWTWFTTPALAQRPGLERDSELIALPLQVSETLQQLTIIDPRSRVVSVYHVDLRNGGITLKSVRNIQWDLQMDEFNGVSPLPREIRSLVNSRFDN
jgi:hypothetical protein